MVVFALISLFSGFVLCCCGKKAMRRKKSPYSPIRRLITFVFFCASLFVILVTVITGLKSNLMFTNGLKSLVGGVDSLFNHTKAFGTGLSPVISKTFDTVNLGAYNFTEELSSVIVDAIEVNPSLVTNVDSLMLAMTRLSFMISRSLLTGDAIDAQRAIMGNATISFLTGLQNLQTQLGALNLDVTNADGTFRLTAPLTIPTVAGSTTASAIAGGNVPFASGALNPMRPPNVPDMRQLRQQVSKTFFVLTDSITDLMLNPSGRE